MPRISSWSRAVIPSLLVAIHSPLAAQETAPILRANAVEIVLSGRVQAQLNTSSVDDVAPTEMILRRVRFGVDVQINDFVSGRVHPELSSGTLSLGDAYGALTFGPALQVQVGRFHRPFGLIEETSSLRTLPIERGVRIRGVANQELSSILSGLGYSDRDIGIRLQGSPDAAPAGLGYAVALLAGPLQGNSGDEYTQQIVARLSAEPVEDLLLAAGWSRRDFPDVLAGELVAGDAFLLYLELGGPTPAPGLHVVAEGAIGDYEPVAGDDFSGVQGWAGYRLPVGGRVTLVEPLLRVSHASIDREVGVGPEGGTLITPGLNIYLGGLNRLMFNFDIWRGSDGPDATSFKSQFQMTF